jgi:hypothetical protein
MFFIRNKKIVIDCFTSIKAVYDFAPIQTANNFYPSWFKTMPSSFNDGTFDSATLKTCSGLINYYQHGIILPLWCDLSVKIEKQNYNLQFADYKTVSSIHDKEQWKYYADPSKVTHFKIESPWVFKCKEDIQFLLKKPYWNFDPFFDIDIVEGILDFKYQNQVNINIFLKGNQEKLMLLKYKTPLLHIIPLAEKQIIIKNHLISDEEFLKIKKFPQVKFINNYQAIKNERSKNKKKCPFGY